jgi:hypothetical protein
MHKLEQVTAKASKLPETCIKHDINARMHTGKMSLGRDITGASF